MKKILGTGLLCAGIGLAVSTLLAYISWAVSIATRLLTPVFTLGAAIILVIIGIYLRGDK